MNNNSILVNPPKFSVLMSVYIKETPMNVRNCFESLLGQTVSPSEWVVVKDGPLTQELEEVLYEYASLYPNLIKFVEFSENQGLGLALKAGVVACSYDLIARMDTDDICVASRFEKQLQKFEENPELDMCGSHIKEFIGNPTNVVSFRNVPLTSNKIAIYQKRRTAFNHMTVMFKKSAVLKAGNYEHAPLMEDGMLWIKMLIAGCNMCNIDEYLVYAQVGADMYKRRGGINYFLKYKHARKKIYHLGYISKWDYIITIIVQFVVAVSPNKARAYILKKHLRKQISENTYDK